MKKLPSYLNSTLYAKLVSEQHDSLDLRLPSSWNPKDKSKNIQVGNNGLDLFYIGPGKQENHAALARTDYPMRPQCGIFYYEMKVISKGDDGYIGIGFCAETNKLERLPGWDPESWGYHGDDGHSFAGSGSGKTYGPCFTTGDIVGCGVNFAENSAFYTKNGKFLGTAFSQIDTSKPMFPAVGLRTPGEEITANFGHEPFVFDIAQYIKDQKVKYIREISDLQLEEDENVLDQLILSYLIHHGYTSTAKAVVRNAGHVSGQELILLNNGIADIGEKDMEQRQLIRSAIIEGRMDDAMQLLDTCFPGVLQEEGRGQELHLMLKRGKFIEMMREYCDKPTQFNNKATIHKPKKKSRYDNTDMMEVDGQTNDLLNRIMQYGKILREEYRYNTQEKSLVEIFSLLAYPDPYSSPVAYLMDTSRRDTLATEVNAAILAYQHRPEMPALERIYRQIILCNNKLAREGHGKATLINIQDD